VHLQLTDEQRLLSESADRFFSDNYDLPRRRERMASAAGFDTALWNEMAELGWLMLRLPERLEGLEAGPVECTMVMQAYGRSLAMEPLAYSAVMGAAALDLGGSTDTALATRLGSGEAIFSVAYTEPRSRASLHRVTTTATADGDGFKLNGTKSVVAFAGSATHFIVSARSAGETGDEGGITIVIVPADANGVSIRSYPTVDGLRAGELTMENVSVPGSSVLGETGNGLPLLRAIVDEGMLALCAEAIGAMETMQASTLEYVKTRTQFGQPIGTFQVIQHRLVDMYMALELAKSMVLIAAAGMADADPAERSRLAATAKVKTGEAIRLIGEDAIQIHGGMGMTDEMAISHYFKRITMIDATFGDTDHHLGRLADLLSDGAQV
jgi:alkylation response protein AidB-like acyl-CoA dehydrogenase